MSLSTLFLGWEPTSDPAKSRPYAMLLLAMTLRPYQNKKGNTMWLRYGQGLFLMGILWGCALVSPTHQPPPTPGPLFHADATDTAILETVRREQETLLSTCALYQSCDQVHFTRAMVSLFRNRKEAATSFQQTIAAAPDGPLADPSALWIKFLVNQSFDPASTDEPTGALLDVMKGTVRAWLGRQRTAVGNFKTTATETVKNPDPSLHNLQLEIRTRDKRIAELTDQLDALKQIDLDSRGTSKLTRSRKSPK